MTQHKIAENRPNLKLQNRKQLEGRVCPVQVCEHTSTAQVLSAFLILILRFSPSSAPSPLH